jgi:hypothetical protein
LELTNVQGGEAGVSFKNSLPAGCGNGASGTIFDAKIGSLYLNNKHIKTDKATIADASVKKPGDYPNHLIVTNNVVVAGGAKL